MKVVLQRVSQAAIDVDGLPAGEIGPGLVVLAGIQADDEEGDLAWVARKIADLRVFQDGDGKMNLSLSDIGGELLVVSQFTLFARVTKGTRPSYNRAAPPETARPLYQRFVELVAEAAGKPPVTGRFAASMRIRLCNEGPVTIIIDSRNR